MLDAELSEIEVWFSSPDIEARVVKQLPTSPSRKSDSQSLRSRTEGNSLFKNNEPTLALTKYSQAVMQAEGEGALSFALANRSAALFRLDYFRDCLTDIEWALQFGYDQQLRHKLYLRRAKCHMMLVQMSACRSALNQYREQVSNQQCNSKTRDQLLKMASDVDAKLSLLGSAGLSSGKSAECDDTFDVHVTPCQNRLMPAVSSLVELKNDGEQGRHLVAAGDINAGTTVIVEQAYCCVLIADRLYDHCYHCLKHTRALLPCLSCCDVGFCSVECRSSATSAGFSGHSGVECGWVSRLLSKLGVAHNALRMLATAGPRLLATIAGAHATAATANDESDGVPCYQQRWPWLVSRGRHTQCDVARGCRCFCSGDRAVSGDADCPLNQYPAILHLVTNMDQCLSSDLRRYSHVATILTLFLRDRTDFFSSSGLPLSRRYLMYTAAILLRHILQLVANAVAFTDLLEVPAAGGSKLAASLEQVRVATGVFAVSSYMNHSCDPSVVLSFRGRTVVVRTIRPVKRGEQLHHCYGPHYARRRTLDRRTRLKEQYYFTCRCDYCTLPALTNFLDKQDSFKCVSCGDVTLSECDVTNSNGDVTASVRRCCVKCGKTADYEEQSRLVAEISTILDSDNNSVGLLSMDELEEMRKRVLRVAHETHECLALIDYHLSQLYFTHGELDKSVACLQRAAKRTEKRYGDKSSELAQGLIELADVLTVKRDSSDMRRDDSNDATNEEILDCLSRALAIVSMEYGEWGEASVKLRLKIAAIDSQSKC